MIPSCHIGSTPSAPPSVVAAATASADNEFDNLERLEDLDVSDVERELEWSWTP